MSHLMTDGEWDNFWFSLDSMPWAAQQPAHCASPRRAVTDAEALVVAILSHGCDGDAALNGGGAKGAFGGRNRTVRSNRCGACAGCKAQDCGVCKNCRDKPRFGGPGIKKKACIGRMCVNQARGGLDEDDGQGEEAEEADLAVGRTEDMSAGEDGADCSSTEASPTARPTTPPGCPPRLPLVQLDLLSQTALQAM